MSNWVVIFVVLPFELGPRFVKDIYHGSVWVLVKSFYEDRDRCFLVEIVDVDLFVVESADVAPQCFVDHLFSTFLLLAHIVLRRGHRVMRRLLWNSSEVL